MNKILFYLFESGVCALVFYLLYALLLKRETGFQYNRFYLLLTPLLALILPLVKLPFLQQPEPLTIFVSQQLAPVTISANQTPTSPNHGFTWQWLAGVLYSLGFVFFTYRLIQQLYRLYCFHRQTRASRFHWQNILVQKTNGEQPTFSFGNCIYWDNSQLLSATETEQIFRHEAVHVRQKHTWDILYLELLKNIFWFNPLFYLYQQALITTHEFIADNAVLRATTPAVYASLLAKQVLHRLAFSFGNYFNKSLTLKRLKMIQQTYRRPSKLKQFVALPIFGILLFVLSCAEPETPATNSTEANSRNQISSQINQDDPVFTFVEQVPTFPGGLEKMFTFLGQNINYPETARKANLEGHVIAEFVITKEGKITDVTIVKSLSAEADAEAKRVIALMPNWNPGKQDGKPLNVKYTLPIRFALNAASEKSSGEPFTIQYDSNKLEFTVAEHFKGKQSTRRIDAIDEIEEIFIGAEQNPQFSGGLEKMYMFLGSNIKYPKTAVQANLEGTVIAKFQVTKEGKIKDIRIEKSLSPETDAEAKRVISLMPTWEPGKQNGRPVNVEYTLPIKFSLGADESKKPVTPIKTGFYWNKNRIKWRWDTPLQNNC